MFQEDILGGGVIHRDYHDFSGYLYIVCDEGSSSTLQIIDITNLPNSVNTVYDSDILFTRAHNIFIDTAQLNPLNPQSLEATLLSQF